MTTLPVRRPLRIRRGDTKRIPFRWYTDRSRSTAVDKSASTFSGSLELSDGTGAVAATIDDTAAADGLVYAIFTAVDTAALVLTGDYVYDVQEVNAVGDVTTILAGPVILEDQVTA